MESSKYSMECITLVIKFSIVFLMGTSFAEDVCLQKSPCKCVFLNGTGFDLEPLKEKKLEAHAYRIDTTSVILQDYYFFPCIDKNPNSTLMGTCSQKLSLYSVETTLSAQSTNESLYKNSTKICNYLGNITSSLFTSSGTALIFDLKPSKTTIELVCAETTNTLQVYSEAEPNSVVLKLYSPEACLKQIEEVGRSLGSTLLIILFSLVIFYLTLGVLTRKFLMGATGLEVIPNLNFWMDLPNLVKDGWAFARNGFKLPNRGVGPTTSPDPNSYDSI